MKYLKEFETEAEKDAWRGSDEHVYPNVVLLGNSEVLYNAPYIPKGVFIQHIDGTLYTAEQWSDGSYSNAEANGIAVSTDECAFVIGKEAVFKSWSSVQDTVIEGVMLTADSAIASTDYSGAENTALIAATDTYGAAYFCNNYTFPNGQKGYLPAFGELFTAFNHRAEIDALFALIGVTVTASTYWSSTQGGDISAWEIDWKEGATPQTRHKNYEFKVMVFTTLKL